MVLTELAREVFSNDRYAVELTGISIDHVAEHESQCSIQITDNHRNARGVAMGGVLFTLADFAAAVAANSSELQTTMSELHWVSLDVNIHYLLPAVGNRLIARCTAIKHGRTTALYQTTVTDPDNGRTLAVATSTMMRI